MSRNIISNIIIRNIIIYEYIAEYESSVPLPTPHLGE